MKKVKTLGPGERGWMASSSAFLTPDGKLHADAGAEILDDQERNEAWLASGSTRDETDAAVEGTPEGTLVVDIGGCKRVPFVLVETVAGADVVPVELADPGGEAFPTDDSDALVDRETCDGCGGKFDRDEMIPGEHGGVYC